MTYSTICCRSISTADGAGPWANRLAGVLQRQDARILDLCCGTGDVLFHLEDRGAAQVLGADFCHPMLVLANGKAESRGRPARLIEADALELPLADNSLDAISIAFGFRNLANYRAGLAEFHRVLKPGGVLVILEFSHPRGWLMKSSYGFYSRVVIPAVGALVSGSREAYGYLPESIRLFPGAQELQLDARKQRLRANQFPTIDRRNCRAAHRVEVRGRRPPLTNG